MHFVKGGAVQKGVRYCAGREVLQSMDELGACTKVLHSLSYVKGFC